MLMLLFLIGSCLGSFCTCLAIRLPLHQSVLGRSHCDYCGHLLSWHQLIPIVSFLQQRGRCRFCHQNIDPTCLISESCGGLGFMLLFHHFQQATWLYLGILAIWFVVLLFLSIVDYLYQFVYSALVLALLLSICPLLTWADLKERVVTALAFFVVLCLLCFCTHGLGFGDVELITVIVFAFGLHVGISTVFLASGCALLLGLTRCFKQPQNAPIPFVPYIALGLAISLMLTP